MKVESMDISLSATKREDWLAYIMHNIAWCLGWAVLFYCCTPWAMQPLKWEAPGGTWKVMVLLQENFQTLEHQIYSSNSLKFGEECIHKAVEKQLKI